MRVKERATKGEGMQSFHIRRLRQEDTPLLEGLLAELDASHYQADPLSYRSPQEMADIRQQQQIFERYFDGSIIAFIACSHRKVVGFVSGTIRHTATLTSPEKRVGFINELVVAEEFRDSGVALSLMDRIESDLNHHDIDEIGLTVASFNQKGEEFYRKMGYRVTVKSMTKRGFV